MGTQPKAGPLSRLGRAPVRRAAITAFAAAMVASAALAQTAAAVNNGIQGVAPSLQTRALEQERLLAKHLGSPLRHLHIAAGWARFPKSVPDALTGTNESVDGKIDFAGPVCEIAVNKGWFEAIPHYEQDEVLAHEVFHCFEYDLVPASHSDNNWILEGLARWADLTLYPHTHLAQALKALTRYYDSPATSLFARSAGAGLGYDAVGFWAHLQDETKDVWRRIPAILRAGLHGHDQAALDAAVPASEQTGFMDSWGSSAFDLAAAATPDWRMASPLAGRYFPTTHQPERLSASRVFNMAPWSTMQLEIGPSGSAPLIEIHFDLAVHGRFGVAENYLDGGITSKVFCGASNASECACPTGDSGAVPQTTPLPHEPYLGLAADVTGGSVEVAYMTPESAGYCKPPPTPVLLGPRTCRGLLPGYNTELEAAVQNLIGEPGEPVETESNGNHTSFCLFAAAKGSIEKFGSEEAFVGVIATATFVDRFTSIAGAQHDFVLKSQSVAGGSPAGVGEESAVALVAKEEANPKNGTEECGSAAFVRVRNVVAGFVLGGVASEACGPRVVTLLGQVADEL